MSIDHFAWVVVLTEVSANLLISGLVKKEYLVRPLVDKGQAYTKAENCAFPYLVSLRLGSSIIGHSTESTKSDILDVLRSEGLGFLACINRRSEIDLVL